MKKPDQIQRFLFDDFPIRGQHVSLDQSWQEIASQGGLEGHGLALLGQALAAVVLLVDSLKIDGSVTLQIRGTGPLQLLVVEASSKRTVRGTATATGPIDESLELREVFGTEHLVITIKTEGSEPHQGIAPLQGRNLSEALEHYFARSEQLPTHFYLACNKDNVSGLLLQKLPGKLSDGDAWDRVLHLVSTLTDEELQQLPIETLLHRLFHEETLRLFEPHPIDFFCSCTRERTAAMLLTLGRQEIDEILLEEEEIAVNCEFCAAAYRFDEIDIEQIFSEAAIAPGNLTHH